MRRLAILLFPAAMLLPALAHADETPCNAWEVQYAVDGTLRISDTMMGAGNGVHPIGPGKIVLRYDNVGNQPGGTVKVVGYAVPMKFTVDARVLGIGTTIAYDSTSLTTPNVCGVSAQGRLGGDRTIRWTTPWNGMHATGHQVCSGAMCGKFGAPPPGRSNVNLPSHPVMLKPFVFSPDMKSFSMAYAVTRKSSQDTAGMTLRGRETQRACVVVKPCP